VLTIDGDDTRARIAVGGEDRDARIHFRPEAARLAAGEGAIVARVIATTFFGAMQRLVAEVAPGASFQVDLPSNLAFRPGEMVAFDLVREALIEFAGSRQ
jgi:putative spermidine/putrescine transport system ATP-binding protein